MAATGVKSRIPTHVSDMPILHPGPMLQRPAVLLTAAVVALAACAGESARVDASRESAGTPAPQPFADSGACPFEGCMYRNWRAQRPVDVRVAHSRDSAVVFQIPANAVVRAVTGIVYTTTPGEVRFADSITIAAGRDSLHITPADTLFLLTSQGEGTFKARFKGRVVEGVDGSSFSNGACPRVVRCAGTLVVRPTYVWWVKVRDASGREGWTDEPEAFDGKDALSGTPEPRG